LWTVGFGLVGNLQPISRLAPVMFWKLFLAKLFDISSRGVFGQWTYGRWFYTKRCPLSPVRCWKLILTKLFDILLKGFLDSWVGLVEYHQPITLLSPTPLLPGLFSTRENKTKGDYARQRPRSCLLGGKVSYYSY
jgi:hypothetical protein